MLSTAVKASAVAGVALLLAACDTGPTPIATYPAIFGDRTEIFYYSDTRTSGGQAYQYGSFVVPPSGRQFTAIGEIAARVEAEIDAERYCESIGKRIGSKVAELTTGVYFNCF